MMQLDVNWHKCEKGRWCDLRDVNFRDPFYENAKGVYIIWYENEAYIKTVKVGSGILKNEIESSRKDPHVQAYRARRTLKVTWVELPDDEIKGVERYLETTLKPLTGGSYAHSNPIKVNLPWN